MHEGDVTGEFRHLLSDIFNGLVENGFRVTGVWEAPRSLNHDPDAVPGSERHWLNHVAAYFSILATGEGAKGLSAEQDMGK